MKTTKAEFLKGAAYTAITNYTAVKNGWCSFEEGKKTVLKWINFGLPEGEYWDMNEYFDKDVCGFELNAKIRNEFSQEAVEALEFFFPERKSLRESIINARKENGISQKELSERIGVRHATITDFENGKTSLGSNSIESIMNELGLTISKAGSARQKENKTGNTDNVD